MTISVQNWKRLFSSINFQLAEDAKKIGQEAKNEEPDAPQDTFLEKLVSFTFWKLSILLSCWNYELGKAKTLPPWRDQVMLPSATY